MTQGSLWRILGTTATLVLLGTAAQAQTVYRIVGADGKVTFSDKPPVTANRLLTAVLLVLLMSVLLNRTKMGKAVRALAQNRPAAILMGVDVERVSSVVFAISSALGVAAGALVGALFAVAPGVSEALVVKGFAVLILGGLGSIPGAIVGGLVLGMSETLAAGLISSAYKDVIAFLVMIVVLLFKPEGLMGKK